MTLGLSKSTANPPADKRGVPLNFIILLTEAAKIIVLHNGEIRLIRSADCVVVRRNKLDVASTIFF